ERAGERGSLAYTHTICNYPTETFPLKMFRLSQIIALVLALTLPTPARAQTYSTYKSWREMDQATDAVYPRAVRISGREGYTGFWFFGCQQFDVTDRYALAMTVHFKDRAVKQDDVA